MKVSSQIRMDETIYNKLKAIAEVEKRSVNAQIEYFVEKCIIQYEAEHTEHKDRWEGKA